MASVEIEGLTKWYGKRRGVEDLSLEIDDKEFVTVFGPAGAGKTTILNLIAGIVPPTRGSVRIGGRVVDDLEPADRNVAMVFESYALYPQFNVFDNMAFPLRSPKSRMAEEDVKNRVLQYARMMKIDHLLDRSIQALSNGQRQRTALGRALVRQPAVFLLDEPLSHLDAKLRHSMRAELKEMRSQLGTTTIYVTHDYLEAMSLGDRVVVINQGKIQQVGTPKEVYFKPASVEEVAKLFGDPEINIVDAKLRIAKGGSQYQLQILGENTPVAVPPEVAEQLNAYQLETVRIGFRPADVEIATDGKKDVFHGLVYSFEPLGTTSVLTIDAVDGTKVRTIVDSHQSYGVDQRIAFKVAPESVIFFNPFNGKFLARSGVRAGT